MAQIQFGVKKTSLKITHQQHSRAGGESHSSCRLCSMEFRCSGGRWPIALLRDGQTFATTSPRASVLLRAMSRFLQLTLVDPGEPRLPRQIDGHKSISGQGGVPADEDVGRGGPGTAENPPVSSDTLGMT